jgi:uncharacterized membrane protein YdbT with pleckstrin-like domain
VPVNRSDLNQETAMTTNTLPPAAPQAIPVATTVPPEPPPEQNLFVVHPSMCRRYPLRCAAYVVLTVASLGVGIWTLIENRTGIATLLLLLAAFLVGRFAYWYAKMSATALVVTNRRVAIQSGVLSNQSSEFPLEAVTDIQVDQGFLGRLMDVGDLVITAGATADKRQMVMMAVEQPLAVADRIRTAKG